jgi:hypothetical protein
MRLLLSRIIVLLLTAFLSAVSVWAGNSNTGSGNSIVDGDHPTISYVGDKTWEPPTDLKMRYKIKEGLVQDFVDVPRYFLFLPDEAVEFEMEHRVKKDRWTDRVLLEKVYFALLYGRSGLPVTASIHTIKNELHAFEAARGWGIMDRESNYCEWDGITCGKHKRITDIRLDSLNLRGTLPADLQYLRDLEHLDLKGTHARTLLSLACLFARSLFYDD